MDYIEKLKEYKSINLKKSELFNSRLDLYIFTCGHYIDLYKNRQCKNECYLRIENNANKRDVTIFRWLGGAEEFKRIKINFSRDHNIDALFKGILKIIEFNCPIEKYSLR